MKTITKKWKRNKYLNVCVVCGKAKDKVSDMYVCQSCQNEHKV